MADPLIYVEVRDFKVNKIFDNKYKKHTAEYMKKLTIKVINTKKQQFTLKDGKDVAKLKFYITGAVEDLSVKGSGAKGEMNVKIAPEFGKLPRNMIATGTKPGGGFKGLTPKPEKDIEYLLDNFWKPQVVKILDAILKFNAKNG